MTAAHKNFINLHNRFKDEQNRFCELELTSEQLRITTTINHENDTRKTNLFIAKDDLLGLSLLHAKDSSPAVLNENSVGAVYCFHLCERTGTIRNENVSIRKRRDLRFHLFEEHCATTEILTIAEAWQCGVKLMASAETNGKWLILINPFGGNRSALSLFTETAAPILEAANIRYDHVCTAYRGHAEEIARDLSLSDYSAIVVVSGDGLLHEVINGLTTRSDSTTATRTPIGILPGGSANVLVTKILRLSEENFTDNGAKPLIASYVIAKHRLRGMDTIMLETAAWKKYVFLGTSYGFCNDLMVGIDAFRWAPPMWRIGMLSVKQIIVKKVYRVKLEYLPYNEENCNRYNIGTEQQHTAITPPYENTILPALGDPLPTGWIGIEEEFVSVDVLTSWSGVPATFHDGAIHIVAMAGNSTRWQIINTFLQYFKSDGRVDNLPSVTYIKALAFRLTPSEPAPNFNLDGEIILSDDPQPVLQGEIRQRIFNVMSR